MSDVTLREYLETVLSGLRELFAERDRLYNERDQANKAAVAAALASAREAADKTELALKEYKIGANEWRDTVKDLVGRMPTRIEVDRRFDELEARIASLRESRSELTGREIAETATAKQQRWLIGLTVTTALAIVAMVVTIWARIG